MYKFGKVSEANLVGVDPRLVEVYRFVIKYWDCTILDGVRTYAEQVKNVAKGVSKTMASKHIPAKGGKGKAIDAMPYPVDWVAIEKGVNAVKKIDGGMQVLEAYAFQGFVAGVAAAKGLNVRQGIDWDTDREFSDHTFLDLPHTEVVD